MGWLPLNDYSTKYKISLSTLRRRIQADEADFKFEAGKYWLADRPISKHLRRQENFETQAASSGVTSTARESTSARQIDSSRTAENMLEAAHHLMQELKRAYISVLHEKESQIAQLKEEVVDLKTLVKILENENERLRG